MISKIKQIPELILSVIPQVPELILSLSLNDRRKKQNNSESESLLEDSNYTDPTESVLPQLNQIEWVECEDVYKPTQKPIQEFISERGITFPFP